MRKLFAKLGVALMAMTLSAPCTMAQVLVQGPKVGPMVQEAKQTSKSGDLQVAPGPEAIKAARQFGNFTSTPRSIASLRGGMFRSPAKASAASGDIYSTIMYDDSWADSAYGMYSIGSESYNPEALATGEEFYLYAGAYMDGKYYGTYIFTFWGFIFGITNYEFDAETWETLLVDDMASFGMDSYVFALGADPFDNQLYASGYNSAGSGYVFGPYDTETHTVAELITLEAPFYAIGFARDGSCYALDINSNLYEVDIDGATLNLIGNAGCPSYYITTGTVDSGADCMLWATCNTDGAAVYAIDLGTAEATKLYDMPNLIELAGMWVMPNMAEDKAPGQAVIESVEFEGGRQTGFITFRTPATLNDGSKPDANERLDYQILAGKEVIAEGSGLMYDTQYKLMIRLAEPGNYKFTVVLTNGVGSNTSKGYTKFVGFDQPSPAEGVKLSWADGVFTLTWEPVETSVHDGALTTITYNVYDRAGEEVATGLSECSWTTEVAWPEDYTLYSYSVAAVSEGNVAVPVSSNIVALGAFNPPFTEGFDDATNVSTIWNIVNANGDSREWTWNNGRMSISYNGSMAMDDWMISPNIALKAGYVYQVSIEAQAGSSYYPERVALYAGKGSEVEDMTITIVEPYDLIDAEVHVLMGEFIPEADGVYNFGIHGCSDADELTLYVDNFIVSEGLDVRAPDAPTALTITPATDGSAQATITAVMPSKAINGEDLAALEEAQLYVNGELAMTVAAPAPGATVTFDYEAAESAPATIEVVAVNEYGKGRSVEGDAFIGINIPGTPINASVVEIEDGVVLITWEPSPYDKDGYPMNPDLMTYTIIGYEGVIAEGLTDLEFEYEAVAEGEQEFVQYGIYAESAAGMNEDGVTTGMIACGTPYETPFVETFADASVHYNWAYRVLSGSPQVGIADDESIGVASVTNDGGFAFIFAQYVGYSADLYSGKILVTEDTPMLTFYYMGITPECTNTLDVYAEVNGVQESLVNVVCAGELGVWNRVNVDMSEYVGKTLSLHFVGTIQSHTYILFDDIRLANPLNYDLAAAGLTAPTKAVTEDNVELSYTITNYGMNAATDYTVKVYDGGVLYQTIEGLPEIAAGESYTGTTNRQFSLFEDGNHQFYFVVEYALDEDLTNNTSAEALVVVSNNDYPVVDLVGEVNEVGVADLTWDAPVIERGEVPTTESFEEFVPFSLDEFGDWTVYNFNEETTYGYNGLTWDNMYAVCGWITFDPEATSDPEYCVSIGLDGVEGGAFMSAWAHVAGANDAWLISPRLGGAAQTVTFWGRSLTTDYGNETIKCYVSTSGKEVADFEEIEIAGYPAEGFSDEWTECSIELPEGARYFAIQSTQTDAFCCMIDEITYLYTAPFNDFEVEAYEVYRDGELIDTVTTPGYTDWTAEAGTHEYAVVVVYNFGKSAPSNIVTLTTTGVASVAATGVNVRVEGHRIIVENAESCVIAAADGKVITSAKNQNVVSANVGTGVYLVTTNEGVSKVIVK